MKVRLSRKASFNAAHRIYNSNWSESKNLEVFGKCFSPNYHGHNYDLIVSVSGEVDPVTGFLMNLNELKEIISQEVEEYLDHKNLNLDIEDFKHINPTVENIAALIFTRMKRRLRAELELKITLYETSNNFVEYMGE